MVDQTTASWSQLVLWLRLIEGFATLCEHAQRDTESAREDISVHFLDQR